MPSASFIIQDIAVLLDNVGVKLDEFPPFQVSLREYWQIVKNPQAWKALVKSYHTVNDKKVHTPATSASTSALCADVYFICDVCGATW